MSIHEMKEYIALCRGEENSISAHKEILAQKRKSLISVENDE